MKIKIESVNGLHEPEIVIKCPAHPDELTKSIIHHICTLVNGTIGYKNGRAYRLSLQDIFYIESVDDKTFLYLEHDIYNTQLKLYEWENQLENTSFVRISKSVILNTAKLKCVRSLLGGKPEATMTNGEKQIINRHYISVFRKKFGI